MSKSRRAEKSLRRANRRFVMTVCALLCVVPLLVGAAVYDGYSTSVEETETVVASPDLGQDLPDEPIVNDSVTIEDDTAEGSEPTLSLPNLGYAEPSLELYTVAEEIILEPFAVTGSSSNLSDFLVPPVYMYDMNNNVIYPPPDPSNPPPTYIGDNYKFVFNFAETSQLQMEYDANGNLTFQLPPDLVIPNPILSTPLYSPDDPSVIIGHYTISTSGVVTVNFLNVDLAGNPTPGGINFIDYYANVQLQLEVTAQLSGSSDGNLDFGNGVVVGVEPPIPPPPSLNLAKSSRYDPTTQRVYYMTTISAAGGTVDNVSWTDFPTLDGTGLLLNTPTNAFMGWEYIISKVGEPATNMIPFTPIVVSTNPLEFSYDNFTEADGVTPLVLNNGDFITIRYWVSLPNVLSNNNAAGGTLAGQTSQNYDFTIDNSAEATGTAPDGTGVSSPPDDTTDHVHRELQSSKSGVWDAATGTILWTIVVGDGTSLPLNDGTLVDELDSRLSLPDPSLINISYYGPGGQAASPVSLVWSGTGATVSSTEGTFTVDSANQFTLDVPPAPESIYQIVITYSVEVPDPPLQGQPAQIYDNTVNFTLPDGGPGVGSTGRVPIYQGGVSVSKTTDGICGRPDGSVVGPNGESYYVDYVITVGIPAGLLDNPIYLYDNLGINPGSLPVSVFSPASMTNLSVSIAAADPTDTAAVDAVAATPLEYSAQIQWNAPGTTNAWVMYFADGIGQGTATGTFNPATTTFGWQYDVATTLTISYTQWISDAAVVQLQAMSSRMLQNAIYVINDTANPNIGQYGNSVGQVNTWDKWPISKVVTPTDNPALFDYAVTIIGDYSQRANALLQSPNATPFEPVYTDTFDSRLNYVANSFYIVDSSNASFYYAPAPGTDVTISGSTLSVDLTTLHRYLGTFPNGTDQGLATSTPLWFAQNHNYVAHYQLVLDPSYQGTAQTDLNNTAGIEVTGGACLFENTASINYNPVDLGKTMTPTKPGSDVVNVVIIINPDGSIDFNDGTTIPGPALVTASDVLTNLSVFTSTIQVQTQTQDANGMWSGVWTGTNPALSFNTSPTVWSANIVPPSQVVAPATGQIDFIIPNQTPVRISYQAQVNLTPGTGGVINNEISIFGKNDSAGDSNYVIGGAGIGANAGRQTLRVFKTGPDPSQEGTPTVNLQGAVFELWVTDTVYGYVPPAGLAAGKTLTGANGTVMRFGQLTTGGLGQLMTDVNGQVVFDNQFIESSDRFLYLLVEAAAPTDYTTSNFYTFFTISQKFTTLELANLSAIVA
ncbi:MAG: hypothetical protein FWE46_02720, partial [Coriobacteriia bacterium]|nr:hypothetical protein [Coriobacteriia bacterium]